MRWLVPGQVIKYIQSVILQQRLSQGLCLLFDLYLELLLHNAACFVAAYDLIRLKLFYSVIVRVQNAHFASEDQIVRVKILTQMVCDSLTGHQTFEFKAAHELQPITLCVVLVCLTETLHFRKQRQ